jgi:ABC-type Fe3+-hydroxamate transport system substrate-binding protein
MSFAIFKGETDIKDLVNRLFRLPDGNTAQQAADALMQANPQLKDMSKVPSGSVIVVPGNAPPLRPTEAAPAAAVRQLSLTQQAQQALYDLDQRLAAIDARATQAASAVVALTHSDQFPTLIPKSFDLKEQLPLLATAAGSLTNELKLQALSRTQTIAALREKL